jgi:hypothetical protein
MPTHASALSELISLPLRSCGLQGGVHWHPQDLRLTQRKVPCTCAGT